MRIPAKVKIEGCRAVEIVSAGAIGIGLYTATELWSPAPLIAAGLAGLALMFTTIARDQFMIQSAPEPNLMPYAPDEIKAQYDGGAEAIQVLASNIDIVSIRFRDMAQELLITHKARTELIDERDYFKAQASRLSQIRQMADVDGYPKREPSLYAFPTRNSDPPMPRDLDETDGRVVPIHG